MSLSRFDWYDYLTFSQKLVSTIKQEAAFRIATSRAYYAAYWKARQILVNNGVDFPSKKSHDFCWKSFTPVRNANGDSIRHLGFALRDRRVHADYQDNPQIEEKGATSDVQDAADLIEDLNNLTDTQKHSIVQHARSILPDYT